MHKFKYMFLALLLGGATYSAKAQNNNFSQYHLTPLYTSPAELGTSDYFRVLGHYRKQSLSQDQGFENFALSVTYPLYYKEGGRRFGGLGISLMNESSGSMGMLQENSLRAGYAYNLQINGAHHVSFGLQGGYYRRNMDIGKATTDSQYQNGVYNPGSAQGESFSDDVSQAFKADAGATWYATDEYGDQKFSLGVAAYNVNKANYEFLTGSKEQAAPIRYQAYGSIRAIAKDRIQIAPTFRFMMEKNYSQLNLGSLFLYQLQEGAASMQESHLGIGAWYSLDNAAIFSLQYAQPSYVVSISYDLPASSNIEQVQVNNGVEVTFGWRMNKGKKRKAAPEVVEVPVQEAVVVAEAPQEPAPEVVETVIIEEEPVVEEVAETSPPEEVELTEEEVELFAKSIHFETGKLNLTADSKAVLDKIAEVLKGNKSLNVELTGYTDNTGNTDKNLQISKSRAGRTRDYLAQKGIAAERISVNGLGEENPITSNDTPEGRERNRRVEINIVE